MVKLFAHDYTTEKYARGQSGLWSAKDLGLNINLANASKLQLIPIVRGGYVLLSSHISEC